MRAGEMGSGNDEMKWLALRVVRRCEMNAEEKRGEEAARKVEGYY
jgi:hypothetical protein